MNSMNPMATFALAKIPLNSHQNGCKGKNQDLFARCIYRHDQTCILQASLGIDGNWFTARL